MINYNVLKIIMNGYANVVRNLFYESPNHGALRPHNDGDDE